MADPVTRAVVEAFYQAYAAHDAAKIAEFLDDDVKWTISGPVDVLSFCGTRHGKPAVMKLLGGDIPMILTGRRFALTSMLVDGDRAAVLGKFAATKREGGHAISYRIAHFIRFCGEKVIEYTAIIDSFDAAEQVLGHPLAVHDDQWADEREMVVV